MILLLPVAMLGAPQMPQWRPSLAPGQQASYRVVVTQIEFEGDTKKVTSRNVTEMPLALTAASGGNVSVVAGPLVARGRSVGRARNTTGRLQGDVAPAPLFVFVPSTGVKVGASWKAPLAGLAPVPAGLKATYKFLGPGKDGKSAEVAVACNQPGSAALKVTGNLKLDLKTGVPVGGKVLFETTYLRPDMKDRNKMVVNSRMTLEYVVK